MSKIIAVVTGTRAEFGLLRNLIKKLNLYELFKVKLLVTGTHLSSKHGNTITEIEESGFEIFRKIYIDLSIDDPENIAKATGSGIISFAEVFSQIKPDLLIVLGDRYEILSAVIPAHLANIPIAHIGGGEITEGAFDESIRHSITKFSHIHFVSTETYKKNVIQLGEDPKNVFNVGGMGIDSLSSIKLLKKDILEKKLKVKFSSKVFLITYHPVTLEPSNDLEVMKKLLQVLSHYRDTTLIFTLPNADPGNSLISNMIEDFVSKNNNVFSFKSLGQLKYFSLIKHIDLVIGNSSSGILEVPYFRIPSINIGNRQKGRLQTSSVINCNGNYQDIKNSISLALNDNFQKKLNNFEFVYGSPGASERIVDILKTLNFSNLLKKSFYKI